MCFDRAEAAQATQSLMPHKLNRMRKNAVTMDV